MKKIDNKYLRRIVYSIQFLMSIVLLSTKYFIQFVPMKYLIATAVALVILMVGEYFLIFYIHFVKTLLCCYLVVQ